MITAEDARHNPDVVTGTYLLNNCYASVLFDTGADRSFVSTEFCALFENPPKALDAKYTIEVANGRLMGVDTIYPGCTLILADKTFKVDLMPVELGSFDVIVGMDWLAAHKAEIACSEKHVRIPLENGKALVIQGEKSGSRLC